MYFPELTSIFFFILKLNYGLKLVSVYRTIMPDKIFIVYPKKAQKNVQFLEKNNFQLKDIFRKRILYIKNFKIF